MTGATHTTESQSGSLTLETEGGRTIEGSFEFAGSESFPRLSRSRDSHEETIDLLDGFEGTRIVPCVAGDAGIDADAGDAGDANDASDADDADDANDASDESDAGDVGDPGDAADAGREIEPCEAGVTTVTTPGVRARVRFTRPSKPGHYTLGAIGASLVFCEEGELRGDGCHRARAKDTEPVEESVEGTLDLFEGDGVGPFVDYELDIPRTSNAHVSMHVRFSHSTYKEPDYCY